MITVFYLAAPGNLVKAGVPPGQAPALPASGTVWVDFESPSEEESRLLVESFGFHPLAVEDALARAGWI